MGKHFPTFFPHRKRLLVAKPQAFDFIGGAGSSGQGFLSGFSAWHEKQGIVVAGPMRTAGCAIAEKPEKKPAMDYELDSFFMSLEED